MRSEADASRMAKADGRIMGGEAFREANGLLALARHLGASRAEINQAARGKTSHEIRITTNAPHDPTPDKVMGHGATRLEMRVRRRGDLTLSRWRSRYKELVVTSRPAREAGWRQVRTYRRDFGTTDVTDEPCGLNFVWEEKGPRPELTEALKLAGRYSKLTTRVNGDAVEPESFLRGAVRLSECGPYRIGIFETTREPGPRDGVLGRLMSGRRNNGYQGPAGMVLAGTTVVGTAQLPVLLARDRMWWCRVETPDGDEIGPTSLAGPVDGDPSHVWDEIRRSACKALLETAARAVDPPPLGGADRSYARLLTGHDWPTQPSELEHWEPEPRAQRGRESRAAVTGEGRHLLIDVNEHSQALAAATADAAREARVELWRPDEQLNGYAWYDGLTRVVKIRALSMNERGVETELGEDRRQQVGHGLTTTRAAKIEVELTTETHERVDVERLETDLVAGPGRGNDTYGAHYTDKAGRLSLEELTSRISAATWHRELDELDDDADECPTEAEREAARDGWRRDCLALAVRIRGSRREDEEKKQRELVNKLLTDYQPSPGQRTIIELDQEGSKRIRFEPSGSCIANQRR